MGRSAAIVIAVCLGVPLAFEVGFGIAVETGLLQTPRPTRGGTGFWQGHHPKFGVWHAPNSETQQTSRCFSVAYRTNSVGARDVERLRHSDRPRVVVLGDSYLEGWGVAEPERLSNLLEAATGVEHLNFAMAHFGTYQEYLVYRDLASQFDHDAVLLGIVPATDFMDNDFDEAQELGWYEYRYRPYLVGEPPDLRHLEHREPVWRRALRRHSYVFNALRVVLRNRSLRRDAPPPSLFYRFSQQQVRRLEAILERLIHAAQGKRMALILIPARADLKHYSRSAIADPLSTRLRALARRANIRIVNLLPALAGDLRRAQGYSHPCDRHWNRVANRVAFEHLRRALGPDFYQFD